MARCNSGSPATMKNITSSIPPSLANGTSSARNPPVSSPAKSPTSGPAPTSACTAPATEPSALNPPTSTGQTTAYSHPSHPTCKVLRLACQRLLHRRTIRTLPHNQLRLQHLPSHRPSLVTFAQQRQHSLRRLLSQLLRILIHRRQRNMQRAGQGSPR